MPSEAIRLRVEAAWERRQAHFDGRGLTCNADMGVAEVREFCGVDGAGHSLLRAAMIQLSMSARSHERTLVSLHPEPAEGRILKLARTIADPSAGSLRLSSGQVGKVRKERRILTHTTWRRSN